MIKLNDWLVKDSLPNFLIMGREIVTIKLIIDSNRTLQHLILVPTKFVFIFFPYSWLKTHYFLLKNIILSTKTECKFKLLM